MVATGGTTTEIATALGEAPGQIDALRAGYRPIRRVAPPDAPWAGVLTASPGGGSCVLVDAALLGDDWGGWYAEQDGHLLAPAEVLRRVDGHDVVIPVCTERVEAFLLRRGRLEDGEVVTLAVSLLRGAAERARLARDPVPSGQWWLTDEGRPVLATDSDGPTSSQLLASLSAAANGLLARPIADAAASAADPRVLLRDLETLESALFELAAPLPLVTQSFAPRGVRDATLDRTPDAVQTPSRSPWVDSFARHIDADLTELVSDTLTRVWRRVRRPRAGGRRRPWLIAAGLAGAIIGLGMLWPAGGGPATAGDSPSASPSRAAQLPSTPDAPADAVDPPLVDWTTAAAALLSRRTACAGQFSCLADVVEDPTRTFPAGVVDGPDRVLTLLDEFGGAAVLRVDSSVPGSSSQLVVVVRAHERLLLRDIHDVAERKG